MNGLERFDNFLITIVNETGGVEGLLHSLFSFLYRRTDFFYEMMPGEKMGFLPGDAEKMVICLLNKVLTTFKAYQKEYFKKHPPKDPREVQKKMEELRKKQEELSKLNTKQVESKKESPADPIKTSSAHDVKPKPAETPVKPPPVKKDSSTKVEGEKSHSLIEDDKVNEAGESSKVHAGDDKFKNIR